MNNEAFFENLIFRKYETTPRYTQDSPVYPDVWKAYFANASQLATFRLDLIITPHRKTPAAALFKAIVDKLNVSDNQIDNPWELASNGETIVARLNFFELVQVVLPFSNWYRHYLVENKKETEDAQWLKIVVGAILAESGIHEAGINVTFERDELFKGFKQLSKKYLQGFTTIKTDQHITLWSVSRNRPATISIEKSIGSTKADAARRLFDIDGTDITWAVLDTGIDARHMAFRKKDPKTGKAYPQPFGSKTDLNSNHTRVVATYDFSRFRQVLASIFDSGKRRNKNFGTETLKAMKLVTSNEGDEKLKASEASEYIMEISKALKNGRMLDWTAISPLLRIPHNKTEYRPPQHRHGTHVAGIIGACDQGMMNGGSVLLGMCPGIELYDIRVLDEEGRGDEFNILAAIHFLRWMNNQRDGFVIHGANMSFSMVHEVASYACGQTPVCEAAERLVAEGTVVVAAAGNQGQALYRSLNGGDEQGFRMVNITDPGNAEAVITVGATHRNRPHAYGVSYFSSKGPTGDGRVKPDLVAPGEKIVSSVGENGTDRIDGTSMAAPHVSGAAALLMAKHRELIGKPKKVKEVLCKTATDLGREKYFQGHGMVDVLRALQVV